MTVELLSSIVGFVLIIGGLGWKLSSELSSIKIMLQVFIAKTEGKFDELAKLEKRVEKLEDIVVEIQKGRN